MVEANESQKVSSGARRRADQTRFGSVEARKCPLPGPGLARTHVLAGSTWTPDSSCSQSLRVARDSVQHAAGLYHTELERMLAQANRPIPEKRVRVVLSWNWN